MIRLTSSTSRVAAAEDDHVQVGKGLDLDAVAQFAEHRLCRLGGRLVRDGLRQIRRALELPRLRIGLQHLNQPDGTRHAVQQLAAVIQRRSGPIRCCRLPPAISLDRGLQLGGIRATHRQDTHRRGRTRCRRFRSVQHRDQAAQLLDNRRVARETNTAVRVDLHDGLPFLASAEDEGGWPIGVCGSRLQASPEQGLHLGEHAFRRHVLQGYETIGGAYRHSQSRTLWRSARSVVAGRQRLLDLCMHFCRCQHDQLRGLGVRGQANLGIVRVAPLQLDGDLVQLLRGLPIRSDHRIRRGQLPRLGRHVDRFQKLSRDALGHRVALDQHLVLARVGDHGGLRAQVFEHRTQLRRDVRYLFVFQRIGLVGAARRLSRGGGRQAQQQGRCQRRELPLRQNDSSGSPRWQCYHESLPSLHADNAHDLRTDSRIAARGGGCYALEGSPSIALVRSRDAERHYSEASNSASTSSGMLKFAATFWMSS